MLNPLLHPTYSSAPTSPVCTRSIHVRRTEVYASSGGHHILSGSSSSVPLGLVIKSMTPPAVRRKKPPDQSRRLSRIVKCRTVDFTEFPEGMREYVRQNKIKAEEYRRKSILRETCSQPGSPIIPRIEIHDLDGTGSEVYYSTPLTVAPNIDEVKKKWKMPLYNAVQSTPCKMFTIDFKLNLKHMMTLWIWECISM